MKSEEEILESFGRYIATKCFDPSYGNPLSLRKIDNPPEIFKDYAALFKTLSDKEFSVLQGYMKERIKAVIHDLLNIFEEDERFKIIYEESGEQIDLNEISEMLKAEPNIEGGWIDRFSSHSKHE